MKEQPQLQAPGGGTSSFGLYVFLGVLGLSFLLLVWFIISGGR